MTMVLWQHILLNPGQKVSVQNTSMNAMPTLVLTNNATMALQLAYKPVGQQLLFKKRI